MVVCLKYVFTTKYIMLHVYLTYLICTYTQHIFHLFHNLSCLWQEGNYSTDDNLPWLKTEVPVFIYLFIYFNEKNFFFF